jgi:hypothetical protein
LSHLREEEWRVLSNLESSSSLVSCAALPGSP